MQLKILGIIFFNLFAIHLFACEINCSEGFSLGIDKKSCMKFLTTDEARKKGLMFQEKLEPNHELHFLWSDSKYRCMWMKNTIIAIDILFIDDDKNFILEQGQPYSKKKICHEAKVVIEANKGELLRKYNLIYE